MGRYSHLSIEEREDIMVRWRDHEGVSRIAREIGRDKSTVSREIARNGWAASTSPRRVYRASTAQARADARALAQHNDKLNVTLREARDQLLALREQVAALAQQQFQQCVLLGGEMDVLTAPECPVRAQFEFQLAERQLRFPAFARAPRQSAQAGQQLIQCEGFDQVVVGTRIQRGHPVDHLVARR